MSTTSTKVKTKELAKKMRSGSPSPKIQEILRERCRQKMRERRSELFCRRRIIDEDPEGLNNTLSEIVRTEVTDMMTMDWSEIQEECEIMTIDQAIKFEEELIKDEMNWIFEEYQNFWKMNEDDIASSENNQNVYCPVCQANHLTQNSNLISCQYCKYTLNYNMTPQRLANLITHKADLHSNSCREKLSYTVVPDSAMNILFAICKKCSLFEPVI